MRAFRNKKEFYDMLWADYQEYRRKVNDKEYSKANMQKCFIYGYTLEKKTRKAKALAEDADGFETYLKDFSGENDGQKKKRCDKFILLCAAKQVCGADTARFGGIFSKVAERENGGERYTELFKTDPDRAYEELSYKLLCGNIQDMFLKKGYKQPRYNADGELLESAKPTVSAKDGGDGYADEIELMYGYFVHAGGDSIAAGSQAEISDEYIGKCEKLYERLLKTDSGMEFIPLYIDPSSGAGVYIIGDGIPKTGSKKYHVYILSFNWFGGYESDEDAEGIYETLDSQYDMKSFESVREAFKSFSEKVGGDEYYFTYTGYNQNILDRIPVNEIDEHFIPLMIAAEDLAMRAAERREKQKRAGLEKVVEGKAKYFQPAKPK